MSSIIARQSTDFSGTKKSFLPSFIGPLTFKGLEDFAGEEGSGDERYPSGSLPKPKIEVALLLKNASQTLVERVMSVVICAQQGIAKAVSLAMYGDAVSGKAVVSSSFSSPSSANETSFWDYAIVPTARPFSMMRQDDLLEIAQPRTLTLATSAMVALLSYGAYGGLALSSHKAIDYANARQEAQAISYTDSSVRVQPIRVEPKQVYIAQQPSKALVSYEERKSVVMAPIETVQKSYHEIPKLEKWSAKYVQEELARYRIAIGQIINPIDQATNVFYHPKVIERSHGVNEQVYIPGKAAPTMRYSLAREVMPLAPPRRVFIEQKREYSLERTIESKERYFDAAQIIQAPPAVKGNASQDLDARVFHQEVQKNGSIESVVESQRPSKVASFARYKDAQKQKDPRELYRDSDGSVVNDAYVAFKGAIKKGDTRVGKLDYLTFAYQMLRERGYDVELVKKKYFDTKTKKEAEGYVIINKKDPTRYLHILVNNRLPEWEHGKENPLKEMKLREGDEVTILDHTDLRYVNAWGIKGQCVPCSYSGKDKNYDVLGGIPVQSSPQVFVELVKSNIYRNMSILRETAKNFIYPFVKDPLSVGEYRKHIEVK